MFAFRGEKRFRIWFQGHPAFRLSFPALPVRGTPVVSFLSVHNKQTCLSVMSLPRNHGVGTSRDHAARLFTCNSTGDCVPAPWSQPVFNSSLVISWQLRNVLKLERTPLSSHQKRQHRNWEDGWTGNRWDVTLMSRMLHAYSGDHSRPQSRDASDWNP